MKILFVLLVAFRALRRNLMRSLLTALGMIIGVGAVITMISIGHGARLQVQEQVSRLGENVVLVFPGSRSLGGVSIGGGSANTLTVEDALAIYHEIPEVVAVSPEVRSQRHVAFGNQNWFTRIYGESADYLQIRQWPLEAGTMFTEEDVYRAEQVAVVGQTIVEQLFDGGDPIGQTIRVTSQNLPLRIIGVLAPKGMSLMGSVQDDIIVVPYTTAFRRVSGRTHVMVINVQVFNAEAMEGAQEKIADLLRERHRIAPGQEDDFTVQTQEEVAQMATATSRTMTFLLGSIAGVSLVVGGIGIMNIMLVSVTERIREIGIRLAVGAHAKHILLQFLVEATLISCMGGVLGMAVGAGVSKALAHYAQWPVQIASQTVLFAFLFTAMVGIFFGFYPAFKAARMDPIEALRYE